jgi:hypothetical protein
MALEAVTEAATQQAPATGRMALGRNTWMWQHLQIPEEQSRAILTGEELGCRPGDRPRKGRQARESQANLFVGNTL